MEKNDNLYDGLQVTGASLLQIDRFRLAFSDGTDATLTLQQIQAIRLIGLTAASLSNAPSPAYLFAGDARMTQIIDVDRIAENSAILVTFSNGRVSTFTVEELSAIKPAIVPADLPLSSDDHKDAS